MMNAIDGDLAEAGKTPDPQNVEYTSKSQNPDDISASERLLKLIGSRKNNEDLYDAAMNVLRELDVLREQNEKLVQNEHQNQEKMLLLNQADEALKREKDLVEGYARRLLCPTRTKFLMEDGAVLTLPYSISEATKRQSDIHEKLFSFMNPERRIEYLSFYVQKLISLSLETQTKIDSTFSALWRYLKELPHGLHPIEEDIDVEDDLSKSIMELFKTTNVSDALQIFNRQKCNVWKRRREILSLADTDAVKALCSISIDVCLKLILKEENFLISQKEKNYVHDILEIGLSVVDTAPKQYKQILWLLYHSDCSRMIGIHRQLEKRRPQLKRSKRMDLYASTYVKLFDLVSSQDMVGLPYFPKIDSCNPTYRESCQYIRFLATSQSSDISFVADTVWHPDHYLE